MKGKSKKSSPGQMSFPWAEWEMQAEAVHEVAEKFVVANCYNPQVACQQFYSPQCQVSETGNGDSSAIQEVLINCDNSL